MTDIANTAVATPPKRARHAVEAAGQWQLIWWRFKRHKLALVSGVVI